MHKITKTEALPLLLLLLLLLSHFSHVQLCDPIDGSPPGSSVLGILQARTLEWVAVSFSIGGSNDLSSLTFTTNALLAWKTAVS